jgi:hypothetical protein
MSGWFDSNSLLNKVTAYVEDGLKELDKNVEQMSMSSGTAVSTSSTPSPSKGKKSKGMVGVGANDSRSLSQMRSGFEEMSFEGVFAILQHIDNVFQLVCVNVCVCRCGCGCGCWCW